MPETSAQPTAAPIDPAAVRIVLFGLPGAGKSSLLGALAQAVVTQEHALNGRLIDRSQRLTDLEQQVYEGKPAETQEPIIPYPVTLEALAAAANGTNRSPLEAVLVDCDGRVAGELVVGHTDLQPKNDLSQAIRAADTLLLVVDAATNPTELERDFGQFTHFLGLLEKTRAERNDVGGLPVYLVLTKCDLLAQKTDTSADWIDRIEERKRQVGQRFREFVFRPTDHDPLPFGGIHLHLWATAIKRPALADAPAKPRDPYGVAELFRQCLESARSFDVLEGRAARRLKWTVLCSALLVALLAGLAVALLLKRTDNAINPLERTVDNYRMRHQAPISALTPRTLAKNIVELDTILNNDPEAFAALPADKQAYVREEYRRLKTFREAYQNYVTKLKTMQPYLAANEKDLQQIEDGLEKLPVPAEFRSEWGATAAGKIAAECQNDINVLRTWVDREKQWYLNLYWEARDIDVHQKDLGWLLAFQRAIKLLMQVNNPPFRADDPNRKLPGAFSVTYGNVYHFDSVREAREQWEGIKDKIKSIAE